jgi:GR25 family glycosyltransferase involved in LPS biosynthesis
MTSVRSKIIVNIICIKDRVDEVNKNILGKIKSTNYIINDAVDTRNIHTMSGNIDENIKNICNEYGIIHDSSKWKGPSNMRGGILGCYLSHINILTIFLNTSYEYCVSLEDDALLEDNFDDKICNIVNNMNGTVGKKDWDLFYLQMRKRNKRFKYEAFRNNIYKNTRTVGTTAMLINRQGAKKILAFLKTFVKPIDVSLTKMTDLGELLTFSYEDNIVHKAKIKSTIVGNTRLKIEKQEKSDSIDL